MQIIFTKKDIDTILNSYGKNISSIENIIDTFLSSKGYEVQSILPKRNSDSDYEYVVDLTLPKNKEDTNTIRKVKIFSNHTENSLPVEQELIKKLHQYGFALSDDNFDLGIAIGGDGAFLHMVHDCNFSDTIKYIGINTGTLGFAQEIYPNELDEFLQCLTKNAYKIENIGVQETKVYTKEEMKLCYSFNEMIIRDPNLKTVYLEVKVNNQLLEVFVGDGLQIVTSFGSTAHNLSYGGSIVYNELHTLQLTPMAPINNNSYRNINNSIILPESRVISITKAGRSKSLILTVDGDTEKYDNLEKIESTVMGKKIKCMRMNNYDYTRRINEKFVGK